MVSSLSKVVEVEVSHISYVIQKGRQEEARLVIYSEMLFLNPRIKKEAKSLSFNPLCHK